MSTAARRWLLLFVVLAAVGGGSAIALGATGDEPPSSAAEPSATATVTPTASATPDSSPAGASSSAGQDPRVTSTEVIETEPPTEVATDERPVAEDGDATVQVSYAEVSADGSVVEVDALVIDRVEDGGACTLTLTRDADRREANSVAFADVTTTICEPLVLLAGDLPGGTWRGVVTYASDDATGSSAAFEVTVP